MNATARINKMAEYIARYSTAEWLERLDAADVPCAPILRRGEIIHSEQVVARGIIVELDQRKVGRIRQPKPAARFEVNEAAIGGPAPRVGEHSREILHELGYDDAAINRMVDPNGSFVLADEHGIPLSRSALKFKHYANLTALMGGKSDKEYQTTPTVSGCHEGAPDIHGSARMVHGLMSVFITSQIASNRNDTYWAERRSVG